jgi:ABC-type tungstate transport system substrate-binding protein
MTVIDSFGQVVATIGGGFFVGVPIGYTTRPMQAAKRHSRLY